MFIPTAQEMASALFYLHQQLETLRLIDYNQSNGVVEAASRLKAFGTSKSWRYSIERSKPLILVPVLSAKLDVDIYPKIFVDFGIDDGLWEEKGFPFKILNLTLEIINKSNGSLIHRSHIDLATHNEKGQYQDGPIFHFQFGGKSGAKKDEPDIFKLRRPRWLHPPMDIVLMTEMLIANFYPQQWNILKNQDNWKLLVAESQMLCYKPFFDLANKIIEKDSLLDSFWASNWDDI